LDKVFGQPGQLRMRSADCRPIIADHFHLFLVPDISAFAFSILDMHGQPFVNPFVSIFSAA
jgi:hypothetical protein